MPDLYILDTQYNAKGQTTQINYGNGVTTAFTYNNNRGWMDRVLSSQGATTLLDQSYVRNAKGMIIAITSPDATRAASYQYDELERLISSVQGGAAASFAYDDIDNMTMNTGLCPGADSLVYPVPSASALRPHAPLSICGRPVSYDANGNALSYDVDGAAGPVQPRSFAYDGENKPIAITQSGNSPLFA